MLRAKLAVIGAEFLPDFVPLDVTDEVIGKALASSEAPDAVAKVLAEMPVQDIRHHLTRLSPAAFELVRSFVLAVHLLGAPVWGTPTGGARDEQPVRRVVARRVSPPRRARRAVPKCQCLCAPLGHETSVCRVIATPGHEVPLPGTRGVCHVPACVACRFAVNDARRW